MLFATETQGQLMDLFYKISVLRSGRFLMAGRCGRNNYARGRKVLLGNRQFRVSEGILCVKQLACVICQKPLPPLPPTEKVNFAL